MSERRTIYCIPGGNFGPQQIAKGEIPLYADGLVVEFREVLPGEPPDALEYAQEVIIKEGVRMELMRQQHAALVEAAREVVDEWETSGVNDPTGGLMLFFDKIEALEKILEKCTNRKRGE